MEIAAYVGMIITPLMCYRCHNDNLLSCGSVNYQYASVYNSSNTPVLLDVTFHKPNQHFTDRSLEFLVTNIFSHPYG